MRREILMQLVETKFFLKSNIFFSVKGCTKSVRDRVLNLVNKGFCARSEHTCDELRSTINESECTNTDQMSKDDFSFLRVAMHASYEPRRRRV